VVRAQLIQEVSSSFMGVSCSSSGSSSTSGRAKHLGQIVLIAVKACDLIIICPIRVDLAHMAVTPNNACSIPIGSVPIELETNSLTCVYTIMDIRSLIVNQVTFTICLKKRLTPTTQISRGTAVVHHCCVVKKNKTVVSSMGSHRLNVATIPSIQTTSLYCARVYLYTLSNRNSIKR
jgi:hypothetical protein